MPTSLYPDQARRFDPSLRMYKNIRVPPPPGLAAASLEVEEDWTYIYIYIYSSSEYVSIFDNTRQDLMRWPI